MAERGTRLPESWVPTDRDIAYAESLGMTGDEITLEAEKFLNYWTALPGQKATKLDWGRTWKTWILKDYGKRRVAMKAVKRSQSRTEQSLENAAWCIRHGTGGGYVLPVSPENVRACIDAGMVTEEQARPWLR